MDTLQGAFKVLLHPVEGPLKRRAPSDQDIIIAGLHSPGRRKTHRFAEPAADPVAFHRIADLPRDGEPDSGRLFVAAAARLENKGGRGHFDPSRRLQEVRAPSQPLHIGTDGPGALRR